MKKFFREFQEFAMKGNVMDMAVGIIIGGAFGKIVSSLVADIVMPPLGLLLGKTHFANLGITISEATATSPAVTINYGTFLQAILDFLIVAMSVFIMILLINSARRKAEALEKKGLSMVEGKFHHKKGKKDAPAPATPAAPVPTPETQEQLLTEIRDLLKSLTPKDYSNL